jgi:zinc transporter 2
MVDAAHMFSDVAGFMISFFAIYISQKKQTFNNSYGYHRSEVLGAILSIIVIWGLLIWLNIEAVNRLITPPENINADVMLVTSIIGLLCNITNFCALNCACGSDSVEEDVEEVEKSESEKDDWTIEQKSAMPHLKKNNLALTEVLLGVYVPRQAHMCIMRHQNRSRLSKGEYEQEHLDHGHDDEENAGNKFNQGT